MLLKEIRLRESKTQQQVAEALNLTQFTYSNYETGKTEPSIETLIKFADYFSVSVDSLIGHQTKNLVYLDSFTPEQQELLEIIKELSPVNCARIKAFVDGIMTAEEEKQATIQKFRR